MPDNRNEEIDDTPRRYTARQIFDAATEWASTKLTGDLDADGNDIDNVRELTAEEAVINSSQLYVQDAEPQDAEEDDVWIDTS